VRQELDVFFTFLMPAYKLLTNTAVATAQNDATATKTIPTAELQTYI